MSSSKETMQDLNARLAAYLDKVRSLESANGKLEKQIGEWGKKQGESVRDASGYENVIAGLRDRQELLALHGQMQRGGSVNVEVNAAPQQDLSRVLAKIRAQYEGIANKNHWEMEAWYKGKKSALEVTVAETEGSYGAQLIQLQVSIDRLEAELVQLRMDMERQGNEYKMLLDIKTHLEMEIAEYRRLLDGEDSREAKPERTVSPHRAAADPTGHASSKLRADTCRAGLCHPEAGSSLTSALKLLGVQEEAGSIVGSEDTH
ncbi:UNVERIFIED_CONTAM: hypothetical protein FKN15_025604 [Acipenser sinensis]